MEQRGDGKNKEKVNAITHNHSPLMAYRLTKKGYDQRKG